MNKELAKPTENKPWYHKIWCWLGLHQWLKFDNNPNNWCVIGSWRHLLEPGWKACQWCNLVIDYRCNECLRDGHGACHRRILKQDLEDKVRKNCCHCPRDHS